MDITLNRDHPVTMHVNLSPEMESYIKAKVSSGFYGNATEVIRDAIRRMQAEEERVAAFRAAVAKGDAQLERGEGVEYTAELMEKITQAALQNMHSRKPTDPPTRGRRTRAATRPPAPRARACPCFSSECRQSQDRIYGPFVR
jgi:antitoxin ParD1/3/4